MHTKTIRTTVTALRLETRRGHKLDKFDRCIKRVAAAFWDTRPRSRQMKNNLQILIKKFMRYIYYLESSAG